MRPAECLLGLELDGGWKVSSRVTPSSNATGGHFSVGYIVKHATGRVGYLKALDFTAAFQGPDFSRELQALTEAYNFERDLLNKCKNKNMDRIVTPIADGSVRAPGNFGGLENVSYLIFEHASGDIRQRAAQLINIDVAWCLRSLHHSAVGLRQLHEAGIAHQDIKPSNVLIFERLGAKIGDLGRASDLNKPFHTDNYRIPGDYTYAPPELFFDTVATRTFDLRCAADLYLLGSLIFFHFARCSTTHALQAKLKSLKLTDFVQTDFGAALPYLQSAFAEAVADLELQISQYAGALTPSIVEIVKQLCEPDPDKRGDLMLVGAISRRYGLERFVSKLDVIATKAELKLI